MDVAGEENPTGLPDEIGLTEAEQQQKPTKSSTWARETDRGIADGSIWMYFVWSQNSYAHRYGTKIGLSPNGYEQMMSICFLYHFYVIVL